MSRDLLAFVIGTLILISGSSAWASPLEQRLSLWPEWTLPAPLTRPSSRDDLVYPEWFTGCWQVKSVDLDLPNQPPVIHEARFLRDSKNRLVGDRAFNASSIGRALLGDQILRIEDDPTSSGRQMTQLRGNRYLETTVIGRRQFSPDADIFLADELVLQIFHTTELPRLSRIETLSRYQRCGAAICAEQWQASYAPPGQSLRGQAISNHHYQLQFTPLPMSAPST
ncbi:DUF6816 family protein [Synechococcus sp. M16CYN]|uniref:DUF6816 family protein n=1 Tax=Synechococcus sp. M16CYN TaxID=3103139 RepID=UPI00333E7445